MSRESESRSVSAALKEAIAFAIREPNEQFAYHRCRVCDGAWFGEKPGRKDPERPSHRLDCPVPGWEEALRAARIVPPTMDQVQLACGSFTKAEFRAVQAALSWFVRTLNREIVTETGDKA